MAMTGYCTKGLENASFVEEDRLQCGIRSRREILIMVVSFRQCPAGLYSSSSKKVAQRTASAHIPVHIVSHNRARHSAQCLEDVHLRIYFGILSN